MASLSSALKAHCPVCDYKRIWRSYGQTHHACPQCGYVFEREEGYWVGALIVAIAIPMALLVVVFVLPLVLTWPDVPWTLLLVLSILTLGISPFAFYRHSKTIWVWLDLKLFKGEDWRA